MHVEEEYQVDMVLFSARMIAWMPDVEKRAGHDATEERISNAMKSTLIQRTLQSCMIGGKTEYAKRGNNSFSLFCSVYKNSQRLSYFK